MGISSGSGHSASRSALDESALDEIRLVHVFQCVAVLAERGGDGIDSHRASTVIVDKYFQEPAIGGIQSGGVDLISFQGFASDRFIYSGMTFELRIVADQPHQAVGDSGRSSAARGD